MNAALLIFDQYLHLERLRKKLHFDELDKIDMMPLTSEWNLIHKVEMAVNATKGIIGRCLRTGKTEIVNFASEEEYDRRMVEEFSFTREEANECTKPARSYWAHPVFSCDELVGVIYLFSNELQVFPKAVKKPHLDQSAKHIANLLEVARVI